MVQSAPFSLEQYGQEVRAKIDEALADYTRFSRGCPENLREAMQYSLLAPGKRLRPMLVLLAAEACGGNTTAAMPAACAVEMIHAYSLIHDDLPAMDDDDLRRGRPTCHKAYGEAVAILAGDALLTLAFEVLARDLPPVIAARCCAVLAVAAGASNLVGGQADDLACEHSAGQGDMLESIHRRKTGALLTACLELGGIVAGADDEALETLVAYGQRLGLLFQITDDLLDEQGTIAQMGKRVGKDQSRGKLTYPAVHGVDASRRRAAELAAEACEIIAPWGASAGALVALANYVLSRNH